MDTIIAAAISNLLAFLRVRTDDDVKVSTTQSAEYSPAFFIVGIRGLCINKCMQC